MVARDVEKINRALERAASQFGAGTEEYKAIELAAKALLFILQTKAIREFNAFLKNFDEELTAQQKQRLVKLGIEP
ncbi:MAG: hypothetical protein JWR69_1223 [Pedosphaera sp.]|nr:hypothetical protein [Pedosphaera sp.]